MKKIALLLAVLIVGSVSVFAAGQVESAEGNDTVRPFRQSPIDLDQDTITVTGTLKLTLSGHPELIADGQTWQLMYPMYLADGIEVEQGASITIEGVAGEIGFGPRSIDTDHANVLHVVRAEISGTEYDLSEYVLQGGPGVTFAGPRGSMPGRGPGGRFDGDDDGRGRSDRRRGGGRR